MVPGVEGNLVRDKVLTGEFPHPLDARTERVPVVKVGGMLMVMLVPVLVTMVQPAAGVQVYPVDPATAVME
jgi:hypothetical protein